MAEPIEATVQTTFFSLEGMRGEIAVDPQDRCSRQVRDRLTSRLVDMIVAETGAGHLQEPQREQVIVSIIVAMIMNGTSAQGTMQGKVHVLNAEYSANLINTVTGAGLRQYARAWADEAHEILLHNEPLRIRAAERWGVIEADLQEYAYDFASAVTDMPVEIKLRLSAIAAARISHSGASKVNSATMSRETTFEDLTPITPRSSRNAGLNNNSLM